MDLLYEVLWRSAFSAENACLFIYHIKKITSELPNFGSLAAFFI